MKVATFVDVLEFLKDLDPWLLSLGIEPKNDRWHEALKVAAEAQEQIERIRRRQNRQVIENYVSGLFDAAEIHEIFRAFGNMNSPVVAGEGIASDFGPYRATKRTAEEQHRSQRDVRAFHRCGLEERRGSRCGR